jgi:hypothetical protein
VGRRHLRVVGHEKAPAPHEHFEDDYDYGGY